LTPSLSRFLVCLPLLAAIALASIACSSSSSSPEPEATAAAVVAAVEFTVPPTPTLVPPTPTAIATPTPIPARDLPIIDLHFHPDPAWGDGLVSMFDRLGVMLAGSGASAGDSVALAVAARHPGRMIAFAGGPPIRQLISRHGPGVWNLENQETQRYLDELEESLRSRSFSGIGEVHVNNWASNIIGSPQYVFPADSPLMQRLWALSATYQVPLSVHMDAEPQSVQEMERLLASDRQGIWLWAHTGHFAEPQLLRRLLDQNRNLYCELSYRTSISGSRSAIAMDQGGTLRESWRQLIEDFPDRFVIGTDLSGPSAGLYAQHIAFWRALLEQLTPETAAKVAYRNAEGILGLTP
jgi:hypothetical protein